MSQQSYRALCPTCSSPYQEEAHIQPADPDRLCPHCLLSETGQFDPEWFAFNGCPFPIGSHERREVMMVRVRRLLPVKVDGDNDEYIKELAKGIVSRSRSTRGELIKRPPRTAIIRDDYPDHFGD